jgi:putative ABC transport system permease protein
LKIHFFSLIFSHLRQKSFTTLLNVLFLAFGVGLVIFVMLVSHQLRNNLYNDLQGIKMVIGAKGSPLQLIFCNIYHIQNPTGNINLELSEKIIKNKRLVKKAVPLALGDNYEGFRIVGTTHLYPKHYKATLKKGKFWDENKPFEATIGADIAQKLNLKLGDSFVSSHGLTKNNDHQHAENKYLVVGILNTTNSVIDKLILTNIKSIWKSHENHAQDTTKQITAWLVLEYANNFSAIQLPREVQAEGNLQSAQPALEIHQVLEFFGFGSVFLQILGGIFVFLAGLSVGLALLNSFRERIYDLAMLRALGASAWYICGQVIVEGVILSIFGAIFGIFLGHLGVFLLQNIGFSQLKISVFVFLWEELYILFGTLFIGFFASIFPAWRAYKVEIFGIINK